MAAFICLRDQSSLLLFAPFRRYEVIGRTLLAGLPFIRLQPASAPAFLKSGRGRKEAGGAGSHAAAPRTDPEEGEIPPLAVLSQSRYSESHNRATIEAAMCGGRCERRAAPQFSAGTKRSSPLCSAGGESDVRNETLAE